MDIKYELNIADYWRIIRKRQWIVIACFLVVFITSVIFTNMQVPLYQAIAAVRIVERAQIAAVQPIYYQSYQTDRMASQEKVITSQAVCEKVAIRLGLVNEDDPPEEIAWASEDIAGMIETEREGMTDVIRIIVVDSDPELAAKVANAAARAYQEVDLGERKKQARTLRVFIEEQLAINAKRLREAEDALKDFQESGLASGVGLSLNAQLAGLENKRLEFLKKYTKKHPDVLTIDEQIAVLKEQIALLPEGELELSRLQREVEVVERTYRIMKEKYEEARIAEAEEVGDVRITNYAAVPQVPFSPNKMLNRLTGAVIGLMIGIFAAFVVESMDTSIGTIEDLESYVKVSVLGVVPFLTRSGEEQPLWKRPLVPIMKYINRYRRIEEVDLRNLIIHHGSTSALAEAFRILRTYIMLEAPKKGCEMLLITSAGPREGKTLVCSNLAIAIAQSGARVLLIDADFRRSVVHKLFGLPRQPGFSDLILGKVKPAECVRSLVDVLTGQLDWEATLQTKGMDHLYIMTAGSRVAMPSELLDQSKLVPIFDSLKRDYDFIMLDSPPVMPVSDSIVLGGIADRTIFVYQGGKTDKRMLMRTIEECKMGGLKVSGIILNYATAGVQLSSPTYYKGKYRYYSDEDKDKIVR